MIDIENCILFGNRSISTRADGVPDTGTIDLGYHYIPRRFERGDVDRSGQVDIADAVALLITLFIPGSEPFVCADAADVNDEGFIDISDAVFLLSSLFVPGSPAIPAPSTTCGVDETGDLLGCDVGTCP